MPQGGAPDAGSAGLSPGLLGMPGAPEPRPTWAVPFRLPGARLGDVSLSAGPHPAPSLPPPPRQG